MKDLSTDKKAVGLNLRSVRESKGWTREQLAEKTDISVSFLTDLELGHSGVGITNLIKLCQALETSADYILFGLTSKSPRLKRISDLISSQDESTLEKLEPIINACINAITK